RQVVQIVRIAAQHRIPLHPISTGRNWGYGASSPVMDGVVVLDLSDLCQIRMVDARLGIVSVQPGVTQGRLTEFLQAESFDWMVPVHGGGPSCSLLGNALERGYGLTPTTDHFAALTSLKAVLPDGAIYQSPFQAMGATTIGAAHRWGIGPYMEGLFSQGNLGIVTEGTIALQPRAQHVEAFFLRLVDEQQLQQTVDALRTILASLGGSISGVNLMNDRRVLSMSCPYPVNEVAAGSIMSDSLCQALANKKGISAWTAAGVIHCPASMRRSIRTELKRQLPGSVSRPIFMNRQRVRWARAVARCLPLPNRSVLQQMASIESLLDLADGIPRRVALPLAYWLRGEAPSTDRDLNPARDGCGLIWYSPLVPMTSEQVSAYTGMVKQVCSAHKIEPLITLTSLSHRLFDSTVPILYRPEQPGAVDRAKACYEALLEAGAKIGCLPYRVGTEQMERIIAMGDGSHWAAVGKLKEAFDPHNLIAPGRYCPHP
ncbi:MAG: FAD-binding oxidoreductase, partial [Pirellulales bacterium]|nr:FAD-binding oxidoreductase [Pirellulales bacterium]